jgi:cysteine sulfinate desulfinase/cysteine desulfurase-like protein
MSIYADHAATTAMSEAAIAAMNAVIPENGEDLIP